VNKSGLEDFGRCSKATKELQKSLDSRPSTFLKL